MTTRQDYRDAVDLQSAFNLPLLPEVVLDGEMKGACKGLEGECTSQNCDIICAVEALVGGHLELILRAQYGDDSLPLQVCRSAAGFYIGRLDPEDESPYARDSIEYYPDADRALRALLTGSFTLRSHP